MTQIITALAVIICACIYIALGGFLFQAFWNYIVHWAFPAVPLLTFWQGVLVSAVLSFFVKR